MGDETIKRYEPDLEYIGTGEYVPTMIELEDGGYVDYVDHVAALAARDAEIERLRRVEEAAREITRWDWLHLLIDHPDVETLAEDVKRLDAALEGDHGR